MKQITNQDSVSAFSITLTGSTSAVRTFRMFDQTGVVAAIQGAKTGDSSSAHVTGTISPQPLYATTDANPIVVSGFNYESSSLASQFAQPFDSLLLTIDERFIIDSQTAVEVSNATSNDVTLTFFVEGFLT
jgi:hypothetical protein